VFPMWGGPTAGSVMEVPVKSLWGRWALQQVEDSPGRPDASELSSFRKGAALWIRWWFMPCLYEVPLFSQPESKKRQPQPSRPRRRGDDLPEPVAQITESDLDRAVDKVSKSVQPWLHGTFKFVKTLQAAPRNHGQVDLMQGAKGAVAVKGVPNWFLRLGQKEFAEAYPNEIEHPWRDIAVVRTLNALRFPYACDLLGVFRDLSTTYVVTSLATRGDLYAWSTRARGPGWGRELQIKAVMAQVCSAVRLLHDLGIAHRDLSLENILLTDAGDGGPSVRIIDYSMAAASRRGVGSNHGKSIYKAPEVYGLREYDLFRCDAFALGVVLYAAAWQRYPWKSTQPGKDKAFHHAQKFGIASLNRQLRVEDPGPSYSSALRQAVEGLLAMNPRARSHLGEKCFKPDETDCSVWATGWL